jgi:hypothetical protein
VCELLVVIDVPKRPLHALTSEGRLEEAARVAGEVVDLKE